MADLTIYEQESLLWAIDVEPSVKATHFKTNGLLVIYENITEYPFEVYQEIFKHFSLGLGPESRRFIEETTQGQLTDNNNISREGFINSYFSVFRDLKVSLDKWKTQL